MFSKFVAVGDKIELQAVAHGGEDAQYNSTSKIYHSSVLEIQSEDVIEIAMPMEKGKLVLVPVDGEFELVFYSASGLFQCLARVIDRYKSNNMYLLLMELTSNLRKYQRREFYRLRCALEMRARHLQQKEMETLENKIPFALLKDLPMKESIIVDISGGGIRFLSSQRYEPGSLIYCSYHLMNGGMHKKYDVVSKVISSIELDNRPGAFEHRAQFYDMDPMVREEIIKYIFEEERKSRQKNKFQQVDRI